MTLARSRTALSLAAMAASLVGASIASAQVRISQVYGAGGLNAGQPNADYIELYNPGGIAQDLTGWSVQISNVTLANVLTQGWFWTVIPIDSGSIPAGGYFLIQANSPAGVVGTPLPTPDLIATITDDLVINPIGSMVVLETNPFQLPSFFCPVGVDPSRQDSVTWGPAFPCSEGGTLGPATSSGAPYQAIHRRGGGCYDTDNNGVDLIAGPPTPRNSASPANLGSYLTPVVTPGTANAGTAAMITMTLQTCSGGTVPTLTAVQGDFTAFGLGSTVSFTGGPTEWFYTLNLPTGQSPGTYSINVTGYAGATTLPVAATLTVLNPLPVNDLCANATVINPGALPLSVNLNVSGATDDVPAPGMCIPTTQTAGFKGVWYTFTAPAAGTLLWNRDDSSALNFYSGTWINAGCGSISQASAICATGNDWGVQLAAGDTALIQISLKSGSNPPATNLMGSFSFQTAAPSNDMCSNVVDIAGQFDSPITANIVYAANDTVNIDGSISTCIPEVGRQGAWYKFTATQVGVLAGNYWPGTVGVGQGIKWAVWARPSSESAAAACAAIASSVNPDICSAFGTLTVTTAPATTYYMLVYNGNNGSGYINTTQVNPILLNFHYEPGETTPNDLCADARDLSMTTLAPLTVTVDNTLATMAGEEWISGLSTLSCSPVTTSGTFISGVWFKYVATQDGVWRFLRPSSQNNTSVIWEVPTGTPNPCSLFTVNNLAVCSRASYVSVSIRAGKTYYMYEYRNTTSGLAPPIILQNVFYPAPEVPSNDRCDTAVDVATIVGVPHVVDQFKSGHDIAFGCSSAPDRSTNGIWYTYTPPQDCVVVMSEDSPQDAGIGLWDGGTSPPPDCNAQTVDPTLASGKIQQVGLGTPMYCMNADRLFFKAQAGHTYYILVCCQFISAYPTYPFVTTFRVLPTVTNEDCATATTITGAGTFDLHNVVRYASSVDNDIALPDGAFSSLNCPTTLSSVTNDTWYRWVAPASGPVSFQVRQYPKPMVGGRLAFYSAGPGNTCPTSVASNLIKCLPFGTPYPDSGAVTFTPTAGQEYYIQFCSTQGTSSEPFGWVVLDINQNPTIGRCCVASACVLTSSTDCTARAGTYGGDGTLCAAPTATTHTYTGSGGPLPDGTSSDLNSGGTFTSTINVPDSFSIADVEVGLSIAHGKYGDLRITLSKGGRTLILSDRGRRGFTPADAATKALVGPGSYRFADSGSQSWFDVGNAAGTSIPSGTYKTAAAAGVSPGFQKTFNGMSSSGIWTLTITDEALNNTGTLSAWTLTLKQGTPAGCTTPGVCCRGSTCNASVPQASCTTSGALAGAVFTTSAAVCGSNAASPCCFADYNKLNGLSVQDIFDFLNDWFAGRPYAIPGGNGSSGTLAVQNIFDFLNAWFAGGC